MVVNRLETDKVRELKAACACLFSEAAADNEKFLDSLDVDMVKRAYKIGRAHV